MFTLKINLSQLKSARMTTPNGKKCIVIPIEENNLYVGKDEKAIYLDIVGFGYTAKNADDKNTHILKQSFSREHLAALTEDQRKALPILGNARIDEGKSEPAPATSSDIPADMALPDDLVF